MKFTAVCFGEVLFDVFPTHKKIGGAPLNVALRLDSFGIESLMVSRVGKDLNGKIILEYLNNAGISKSFIQIDTSFKTGEVTVFLDEVGSATYDINSPVAWDKIETTSSLKDVVSNADVFIFGSLVCRDPVSKLTLFKLLKLPGFKVFDVNLRPPNYDLKVVLELMKQSDFIKFNDEEIVEICKFNNLNYKTLESSILSISQTTDTNQICVTLGAKGAVLYLNKMFYYNQGYRIKVADTVGAGDSFLASLIYKLMKKEDPQESLDFACAAGALVASSPGANPTLTLREINQMKFNK